MSLVVRSSLARAGLVLMGALAKAGFGATDETYTPSLDFSDARNSQYIGQVV